MVACNRHEVGDQCHCSSVQRVNTISDLSYHIVYHGLSSLFESIVELLLLLLTPYHVYHSSLSVLLFLFTRIRAIESVLSPSAIDFQFEF